MHGHIELKSTPLVERSRKQDRGPILEYNLLNNVWKHSSSYGGLRVQRKICRWKVRETDDRMFKIIVATVTNSSYFSTAYFSLHPQASKRRRMLPNVIKKVIFEYGTRILLQWPFHRSNSMWNSHFWLFSLFFLDCPLEISNKII